MTDPFIQHLRNRAATPFTPAELYNAYPHSDLLGIEPPEENEAPELFLLEIGNVPFGDTLFRFLANELFEEEIDREEAANRCRTAIDDIQSVLDAIEGVQRPRCECGSRDVISTPCGSQCADCFRAHIQTCDICRSEHAKHPLI